ncbi:AlpA family phage regulatory protein [Bradyrhizobium huanghuaihaiense]|uniref:helix-turn-helix transcriptional regulator n=1 Tax=Bradyrhizobium huanghuaihaiense TaxID=990078 RepID=UPI0021AAC56B|nr:AlpA family phage regulatory protein [Bradyrhizobium sp. CB3035]UWU79094.1 AlpA family phage regulatory protein [Bradyrhizobium sp. CB3035]
MSEDSAKRRGRIITEKEVLEIIRLSRTTLYRLVKAGKFPPPHYATENKKTWRDSEVYAWWETADARNPNRRRGGGRRPNPRNSAR